MFEKVTGSFDRRSLEAVDLERMAKKADKLIEDSRFKEENFRDAYEDLVDRDLNVLRKLKDEIQSKNLNEVQEKNKKIGTILEALVLWNGDQNLWFGERARMLKTSEYDDIVNGVDIIAQFLGESEDPISHLGLAMDVSIGQDLTDKFGRILEDLEKGELRSVKYFHSKKMHLHGRLSNVSSVVIGISPKTVLTVADLWMEGKNKELAQHMIQVMILSQVRRQLDIYRRYAGTFSSEKHQVAVEVLGEALKKIDRVISEKKDLFQRFKYDIDQDESHTMVMSYLDALEKSLGLKK